MRIAILVALAILLVNLSAVASPQESDPERPPTASRLSPFSRGTQPTAADAVSPLERGRAAEGGRGSLTPTVDPFDALHSSLVRAAANEVQQIRRDQTTIQDVVAGGGPLTVSPRSPLPASERGLKPSTTSLSQEPTPSAVPPHITNPALRRLHTLQPLLANIFRDEGVPLELLLVGLIESGYQADAVSPAQAVGMWQFVPATARRFGLINDGGDFRTDVVRSTRAAAQYLRLLLDQFQDWRLALAAYNAGEDRVEEAIRKAQSRDFSKLSRLGLLPQETINYVPAVLGAIAEARNHGLLDRPKISPGGF